MKPIFKLLDWIDINKLSFLSCNKNDKAIELLKQNFDKIDWMKLSSNKNDKAIKLLKQNQDKIDWYYLSSNENDKAIELLKQNQDKINWRIFSSNKYIFELDYNKIKENFQILGNEILEKALDPDRIKRLSIIYNFNLIDWFLKN